MAGRLLLGVIAMLVTGHLTSYGRPITISGSVKGARNILNFVPKDPRPFDPFDKNVTINNPYGYTFDTRYNYAPVQGIKGFAGLRYTIQ